LLVVKSVPETAPLGTMAVMCVASICVTAADRPLKVAVAEVKVLAVAVIVTSVPTGPESGVMVFVGETEHCPVPSTTKVYLILRQLLKSQVLL